MAVVALLSRTAGVGKSTLTAALAETLSALHGRRVLVVDLDPQATVSRILLGQEAWSVEERAGRTTADVLEAATSHPGTSPGDVLVPLRVRPTLDVMPGSPLLQSVEDVASERMQLWAPYAGSPYLLLSAALTHAVTSYDVVLIDCGHAMGLITLNALAASSGYLMVTTPALASLRGLQYMQARIDRHAVGLGKPITNYGTVVSRVQVPSSAHAALLSMMRTTPGWQPVWSTVVAEGARLSDLDVAGGGSLLRALARGGRAPEFRAIEALSAEFLQRIG